MVDIIWIAVLISFALWWLLVYSLDRAGILKKYNITAYGPLIMWRTYRFQGILDYLSKPKLLWRAIVTLCIPMIVISMLFMLMMIIVVDIMTIINTPEPGQIYAPQNILAIPGVNEYIPFVWGWIALIIAMVVHEFGHAILAKVEGVSVKSLGLLLIPIPLGAFAELDEEEMFGTKSDSKTAEILGPMNTAAPNTGKRKTSGMQLVRILGAGVIVNFLVAIIAFALLFYPVMGAIAATNSEMVIVNIAPGSIAADAGIHKNMVIQSVDGRSVANASEFDDYIKTKQGSNVTITGMRGNDQVSYRLPVGEIRGVYILGVIEGSPAAQAGLKPNMWMTSINGTSIRNYTAFSEYMNHTSPGQNVTVGVIDKDGTAKNLPLTLMSGYDPRKGYMGFSGADLADNPLGIYVGEFNAEEFLYGLKHMPDSLGGWFLILTLPVWEVSGGAIGFSVFQSDLAGLFHPVGWATSFGNGVFYLAICLFWIGWLNLNIGLFNCLPMIPLDGGHIFREITRMTIGRIIHDEAKTERISKAIVNGFAITLFSSLVFMIMAPYIVHGIIG